MMAPLRIFGLNDIATATLAACATWTHAAGGLLLPMVWYWWRSGV
jgi:hypothetical protein